MPSAFFSPNNKITGGALFASFNSKDANIYFGVFPQIANNESKKDNFDFKAGINVKFSQDEAGDIIQAVRNKSIASYYHNFEGDVTKGSFKYFNAPSKDPKFPDKVGFGFSVDKNGKQIKVAFTLGSAERLSHYLSFALEHINSAIYSVDVAKNKEYTKTKAANETKPAAEKPASEPKPVPSEDPVDNDITDF